MPPGGGGGGGGGRSLPLEAVPDVRESPSESTLNKDFMVDKKIHMGAIP